MAPVYAPRSLRDSGQPPGVLWQPASGGPRCAGAGRPARPRLGSTPGAPNLSLDSPVSLVPLASCFPREVGPGVAQGLEQLNGLREHLAVFAQVCLEQVVK